MSRKQRFAAYVDYDVHTLAGMLLDIEDSCEAKDKEIDRLRAEVRTLRLHAAAARGEGRREAYLHVRQMRRAANTEPEKACLRRLERRLMPPSDQPGRPTSEAVPAKPCDCGGFWQEGAFIHAETCKDRPARTRRDP